MPVQADLQLVAKTFSRLLHSYEKLLYPTTNKLEHAHDNDLVCVVFVVVSWIDVYNTAHFLSYIYFKFTQNGVALKDR